MSFDLDGHYVRTTKDLQYGNPGECRMLPAGSQAIAETATNLPGDSPIEYWLFPIGEWPKTTRQWAEGPGCGASWDDLADLCEV